MINISFHYKKWKCIIDFTLLFFVVFSKTMYCLYFLFKILFTNS